jgi:N-acetylneuraminate synthase/N,N'-diacetyllegionaminate synthase
MKLFGKDLGDDVVIIAEIGVNHEGDVEAASRLLKLAAESGADAAKFQSYTPERFISAADPERFARVTRFSLDEAAHRRLAREAQELGIAFLSTAVTEDWVPLIAELSLAIKIASGDLDFEVVIRKAARTGRTVILSTGLGTVEEIDNAVGWVRDEIGEDTLADRLVLMHCVSAYPAPLEEANLLAIPFLAERYGVTTGYSNHVVEPDVCIAAAALGASVIEVHFTDQREGRTFHDHALSFEPSYLARLVAMAPRIRAARGSYGKERMACELPNLEAVRKGLVAARDLETGSVLERADMMFARPAGEFPARDIDMVVGKRLTAPLRRGDPLRRDVIG